MILAFSATTCVFRISVRGEQVFPLEKEADIRRHYTNGLKQALYLQSGSSRAGMTLAKENQNRLWQALKASEGKPLGICKQAAPPPCPCDYCFHSCPSVHGLHLGA